MQTLLHLSLVSVMDYLRHLRPFSNKQVNRAAATLVAEPADSEAFQEAMGIVTEWRTLHEGPLTYLRTILDGWSIAPFIVTRLKRIPTIIDKLRRQPNMRLSTMQDIGGLRAVANNVEDATVLASKMHDVPPRVELKLPIRDYISHPTRWGYRGLHLVYIYRSQGDEDRNLDGLRIEVQIRTKLQHIWATTVEVVGSFRGESLKSGEGSPEWLEFFRLAGDFIAELEVASDAAPSPALVALRDKLHVASVLGGYRLAQQLMETIAGQRRKFFVLVMDAENRKMTVVAYEVDQFDQAVARQIVEERSSILGDKTDTVMVSADSMAQLREGYPNYFADTREFVSLVYGGDSGPDVSGWLSVAPSSVPE